MTFSDGDVKYFYLLVFDSMTKIRSRPDLAERGQIVAKMNFRTYDRLGQITTMSMGADDAILDATVQAVVDALNGVLLGSAVRGAVTVENVVDVGASTPPADANANRGSKWLLRLQDTTTGQIYTHEIGTADLSALPAPNTDFLDLADAGVGEALKDAVDAAYESPDGNAGVLLSVQQVTRTD